MSWDHYWHNILNVGLGKLSQGIINLKSCMRTLPLDQSCPKSTLIDFLRKNQSFGLHRKFGRAEIPSKGIKHMEIYGQFIYFGWEWMKRAVGKVTTCSKILILNEAHSHPKKGGNAWVKIRVPCIQTQLGPFTLLSVPSFHFSTTFSSAFSLFSSFVSLIQVFLFLFFRLYPSAVSSFNLTCFALLHSLFLFPHKSLKFWVHLM